MIGLDLLYLAGLLIVWYGNFKQVTKMLRTKSTKSLSMHWLIAIALSITIRLPRAITSDYWVWSAGYVISTIIILIVLGVAIYYRRKYPNT